jgi:hypothetical protein
MRPHHATILYHKDKRNGPTTQQFCIVKIKDEAPRNTTFIVKIKYQAPKTHKFDTVTVKMNPSNKQILEMAFTNKKFIFVKITTDY